MKIFVPKQAKMIEVSGFGNLHCAFKRYVSTRGEKKTVFWHKLGDLL
jgi:hypothetical protein